ncbi:MAG: hypothetical protein ACNYWU_12575, partial [Desulfobacterales bacterium]
ERCLTYSWCNLFLVGPLSNPIFKLNSGKGSVSGAVGSMGSDEGQKFRYNLSLRVCEEVEI